MTRLSVNINKIATIRNARGGNNPNLVHVARDCELFGAEGITVHPRPDERHIRYEDVFELKKIVRTEFNIEGYPSDSFIDLVLAINPDQVTLVPDPPGVLTSNAGWDTIKYRSQLKEVISTFKAAKIRTSIFIETNLKMIEGAKEVEADRIELYTESYANGFSSNPESAVQPFKQAAAYAAKIGLGVNAGHDLDLNNLKYFKDHVHPLLEVSIGHALICDALYLGLENTIQLYRRALKS